MTITYAVISLMMGFLHPSPKRGPYLVPRGRHARSRRRFMFSTAMVLLGLVLCFLL